MGRGRQHKLRAAPVYHLNFPENCMKMKKIGLMEGRGAHPKFYYVDPPLDNEKQGELNPSS